MRHKGVLTHIYAKISPQNGVIRTFRDSLSFKNNNFSNSSERVSKICLYHDKFSIIYPMGNKTQKNIVLFHFRKFATKIYLRFIFYYHQLTVLLNMSIIYSVSTTGGLKKLENLEM